MKFNSRGLAKRRPRKDELTLFDPVRAAFSFIDRGHEISMSTWRRFHLEDTIRALVTSENQRFFVQMREPPGSKRNPIEFYRWNLTEAKAAADRLVQAYYPHDCDEQTCGGWQKLEAVGR